MESTAVVARVGLDDRGFQEGIQKIQRSLKLVQSEFAAASTKLGDFGKSTEGLKLKADSLSKQMELQKAKVAALRKSYEESAATKGEDSKATENLRIKLNYATADMNKMENELSEVNRQIEIQSSSFTKLGNKLEGIGSKMKTVGDGFSNVGSTLTKTVTVPIMAAGAGLFKLASDFDEASDAIRAGTGATGAALSGLEADFKAVYKSVDSNIGDTSKVIADLNTRTGLSGESLQNLSEQMLKLSKITKEDLNALIPSSTRMFKDAGIEVKDYANALDYTFKVSQSTGIGVSKLQELMTQFGGPLRQMGFDWKTSAAMLGKFEKEGVNTNLVLGSLRIALGKMAKEGIAEPNKALAEMIAKIKEAGSAGEANALALEMFGAKAGPDMAAAIREGRLNLEELINSLNNSPESIEKVYSDTADAAEQFVILKNKIAVSLEPLAKTLFEAVNKSMPSIEKFVDALTRIIDSFNKLSPAQQEMILKLALIVAAIGPLLTIIGKLISAGGLLSSSFGKLSKIMGASKGISVALGSAFTALTGPIAIVIGACIALLAVFVGLYKNNESFRNDVNETWNKIKTVISEVIEILKALFLAFIEFAGIIWEAYGDNLISIITTTFSVISNIVSTALNLIKDIIVIVTGIIKGDWSAVWEGIKSLTSNLWNGIKSIIASVLNLIKGLIKANTDFITSIISKAWDIVKTVTLNIWQGIKNAIESPIIAAKNTVKSVLDSIVGFFRNLKIPEIKIPKIKLPHFEMKGNFSIDPPSVPKLSVNWYSSGGIFSSPSIIGVGEAGTEAVIPINKLDDIIARALLKAEFLNTNKQYIKETQKDKVTNNYDITINNPKAEPASDSIRLMLMKHSYGLV